MRLHLIRHGEALSETFDPARPLSALGREQAKRIGEALARVGVRVAEIRHSPKARAAQTAAIVAEAIGAGAPVSVPGLLPNDPVGPVAAEIEKRTGDLMLVGHLPFVERLAALLLTGRPDGAAIGFDTAAAACLVRDPHGLWVLAWLLPPVLA
jgi:phosphohistidine phosphatase